MPDTSQISPQNPSGDFERCEQCSAPVDRDQRYCVNCGAHRRHVPDPAAAYMSRTTAHRGRQTSVKTATGVAVARMPRRRPFADLGLLGALALALIPVAAAVGVLIGRSSNNQDSRLIRAMANQRAQVSTTVVSGSGAASTSRVSSSSTPGVTKKRATSVTRKSGATKKKQTTSAAKTASSTATKSNGAASKITGSKVTASQQSQGSSEAQKIQNSTGQGYVQGANNLPSSVVVGQ